MPVEVYGTKISAPCRCTVSVLEMLKLPYEWKQVDLGRDNLTPEYLKMNPQHTVPTVKDGDLVITESRAAIPYLAGKAGGEAGEKLYPVNLKVRAVVDQRLLFDMGTFYKRFGETVYPVIFTGATVGQDKIDALKEALGWVQDFVKPTGFAAGTTHVTLADVCLDTTYGAIKACGHVDLSDYPELEEWHQKVRAAVPNFDSTCAEGEQTFAGIYKAKAK